MADFSTFDKVVISTRQFLQEANELTEENEEQLKNITEVKETLRSMPLQEEKGNEKESAVDIGRAVENACETVVLGDYLVARTTQAALSTVVKRINKEIENPEAAKLPEVMLIKVDEAKHFLKKAGEVMEVADGKIKRITLEVRQARRKKFNITDEERIDLKMDTEDLERELVTCKEYLDGANRAIEMLSSDINKEILKYCVVAGAAAGVAAVGVAAIIYVGPANICNAVASQPKRDLDLTALLCGAAAVAGAVALLVRNGWFTNCKEKIYYRLHQKVICFWLHSILRSHSNLMQESYRISQTLKEMWGKLVFC